MARIRTIKPEFFRHEGLQDLELANPGKYPMMVFEGLFGQCDSKGRFEWKPRMLKLDILPFLPFDMADTLHILLEAGLVRWYAVDGKQYGEIPTFEKHQRISGKELSEGEKYPEPQPNEQGSNREAIGKQSGSVGEIPESQEGKGKEEEGKGKDVTPGEPVVATETEFQEACRKTWGAYKTAYAKRYAVDPVRNAKTNSQVKQIVQRLGGEEAPHVASFFVGHANAFYVRKSHDLGSLLTDAEKLRMEWATGRMVTTTGANQADKTQTNFNSANEAIRQLQAEGAT